jgi:hypothetical protein
VHPGITAFHADCAGDTDGFFCFTNKPTDAFTRMDFWFDILLPFDISYGIHPLDINYRGFLQS